VSGGLDGAVVLGSFGVVGDAIDILSGQAGQDWFFATSTGVAGALVRNQTLLTGSLFNLG
jgi:hypothetical protein